MEKQEFINIVNKHLAGQGTQIDTAYDYAGRFGTYGHRCKPLIQWNIECGLKKIMRYERAF